MPFSTVSSLAALRSVSGMRLVLSFRQQNLPQDTASTGERTVQQLVDARAFSRTCISSRTIRRTAELQPSTNPAPRVFPSPNRTHPHPPPIARLHNARLPFAVLAPRTLARNPSRTRPQCFFDFFCGKAFPTHGKTNPKSTAGTSTFSPASLPPLPA